MTHDSVATWLYLASQGGCNYALVLFQQKQKHFRSKKRLLLRKITATHFSPRGGVCLGWRRIKRVLTHGDLRTGEGPGRQAPPAHGCQGEVLPGTLLQQVLPATGKRLGGSGGDGTFSPDRVMHFPEWTIYTRRVLSSQERLFFLASEFDG